MGVYGMPPDSIVTPSSILPEEEKEDRIEVERLSI